MHIQIPHRNAYPSRPVRCPGANNIPYGVPVQITFNSANIGKSSRRTSRVPAIVPGFTRPPGTLVMNASTSYGLFDIVIRARNNNVGLLLFITTPLFSLRIFSSFMSEDKIPILYLKIVIFYAFHNSAPFAYRSPLRLQVKN